MREFFTRLLLATIAVFFIIAFLPACAQVVQPSYTPAVGAEGGPLLPPPADGPVPALTPEPDVELARVALSWEKGHPERAAWSDFLIESFMRDSNTYFAAWDISELCPGFRSLSVRDRATALAEMVVGMAKPESNWNPSSIYKEKSGKYSRGLLQMSYGDGYPGCPNSKAEANIHDPIVNLRCGLSAMHSLVLRDGTLAQGNLSGPRGLARYWSCMRTPDVNGEHHKFEVVARVRRLSFCR